MIGVSINVFEEIVGISESQGQPLYYNVDIVISLKRHQWPPNIYDFISITLITNNRGGLISNGISFGG